jgi:hypothetical protein
VVLPAVTIHNSPEHVNLGKKFLARANDTEYTVPNPAKPELKIEYLWVACGGSIIFDTLCHKSRANMI